ncbi:unnamed protein product [Nezara viridula]|uniref:Gamma-interferon inducible lysosomal thiol reductase n=1 Tax=Nezara viridula TaxID=85310 RepID=A0A9P0EGV7_NEZVI|nr:unnamed protein product [Nezara viridula]
MAVLFLLAVSIGCVLARPSSENVTPVEVTLYYETMCPSCRLFVPSQLLPAYTDTKFDYTSLISKLTLVPYGWVKVKNATSHEYQCQHGQSECEGNRLHSCAIKYIPDQLTTLEYISCLDNLESEYLAFESSVYPIDKCQDKLPGGLYSKIIDCYNSEEGWTLFQINGEKTTSFFTSPAYVPYVSYNNKRDDDLADSSIEDFKMTLCKVAGVVNWQDCSSWN